ncbi:hypothetical protein ABK040_000901 [Willaertia magna]
MNHDLSKHPSPSSFPNNNENNNTLTPIHNNNNNNNNNTSNYTNFSTTNATIITSISSNNNNNNINTPNSPFLSHNNNYQNNNSSLPIITTTTIIDQQQQQSNNNLNNKQQSNINLSGIQLLDTNNNENYDEMIFTDGLETPITPHSSQLSPTNNNNNNTNIHLIHPFHTTNTTINNQNNTLQQEELIIEEEEDKKKEQEIKVIDEQLHQLTNLEKEQFETLLILRKKRREIYLPNSFINFCKHEINKIYGWNLENEKHSVQSYTKNINYFYNHTNNNSNSGSNIFNSGSNNNGYNNNFIGNNYGSRTGSSILGNFNGSNNNMLLNTYLKNDVNYNTTNHTTNNNTNKNITAYRIVGILSGISMKDAFEAFRNVKLKKELKIMEEVMKVEDYYFCKDDFVNITNLENVILNSPNSNDNLISIVEDNNTLFGNVNNIQQQKKNNIDSFDIIYQRSFSPSSLFISKREYLTARYFIEEEDRIICIEKSIDKLLPIPPILKQITTNHDELLNAMQLHHDQLLNKRNRSKSTTLTKRENSNLSNHSNLSSLQTINTTTTTNKNRLSMGNNPTTTTSNDSCDNLLFEKSPKGVIRADILFQITVFEKLSETETKWQVINHIDVKGWLKSWTTMSLKNSPHKVKEEFENLVDYYIQHCKNKD